MARRDALAGLSASKRERLAAVAVDMGYGRSRPQSYLIQGSADHVDRLVSERDLDPDDRRRWTAGDFVAGRSDRGGPAGDRPGRGLHRVHRSRLRRLLGRWVPAEDFGEGWWSGSGPGAGPGPPRPPRAARAAALTGSGDEPIAVAVVYGALNRPDKAPRQRVAVRPI